MMFSFLTIIQEAKDENEANDQIFKTNEILFNSFMGSYAINGIFEVDNIEDFSKSLQENLTQFVKEYKEKCENV